MQSVNFDFAQYLSEEFELFLEECEVYSVNFVNFAARLAH
jgi:hypothetical protein